ncbi:MAG: relaxase/mobilization nuclease domain-containing protein [Flavisolibacter sp.]
MYDNIITHTLHVSLNFPPREELPNDIFFEIAGKFMKMIGFGNQPYLVYKHLDAAHPHLHIVSTTIREDGSRIATHNLEISKSMLAVREIEKDFGLRPAILRREKGVAQNSSSPEKLVYGKDETRSGIEKVVAAIFGGYNFTSLIEFNAALRQFNVYADRGREGSKLYQWEGLLYRILDPTGKKKGIPIKASTISFKPTLANLEQKFCSNAVKKADLQGAVSVKLNSALKTSSGDLQEFLGLLGEKMVCTIEHRNPSGMIDGFIFVDNEVKCVCKDKDLCINLSEELISFLAKVKESRFKFGQFRNEKSQEFENITAHQSNVELQGNGSPKVKNSIEVKEIQTRILSRGKSKSDLIPKKIKLKRGLRN